MTSGTIYNSYKWFSLVTLVASIIISMTLIEGTPVDKFWIGLLVNLQFHLAFQFLSRVPYGMYQYMEKENPRMKTLAYRIFRAFSWMIMIVSAIGFFLFINAAVTHHQYQQLAATMSFIAVFLGGYSFNLKLREYK